LRSGEPGYLRCAGTGCKGRVEEVDVEGDEDRPAPGLRPDDLRVPPGTEPTQVLARDQREAEVARHVEILRCIDRPADPGLYGGSRVDESLLGGALERGAVEVLLAEVRVPGVGVCIQLHEGERSVPASEQA